MYTCLRTTVAAEDDGYPLSNVDDAIFLLSPSAFTAEMRMFAFCCAWIVQFCLFVEQHPHADAKAWLMEQGDPQRRRAVREQAADIAAKCDRALARPASVHSRRSRATIPDAVLAELHAYRFKMAHRLLFVWDDARSLALRSEDNVSLFVHSRRAWRDLACLPSSVTNPVLFIVTDTSGHLANFAPSLRLLPSARETTVPDATLDLLPTFCAVDKSNVGIASGDEACIRWGAGRVPEFDHRVLFSKGRAGFGAMLQVGAVKELIVLMMKRLLSLDALVFSAVDENLQPDVSLAMLSTRITLHLMPSSRSTADLVGSNLGTAIRVTDDREAIHVIYPSEPVMAEASSRLMRDPSVLSYSLAHLQHLLLSGLVDAGKTGELLTQLILLRAFDCAVGARKTSDDFMQHQFVLLKDVLDALDPPASADAAAFFTQRGFIAYISLSHFMPVAYRPTLATVAAAAGRGAGIMCKEGQPGIDLALPLVLAPVDGSQLAGLVQGDSMSYVSVQVRNKQQRQPQDQEHTAATTDMRHSDCFADPPSGRPYLSVYVRPVDDGDGAPRPYTITDNGDPLHFSIVLPCLTTIHLIESDPVLRSLLSRLLHVRPDPLLLVPSEQWALMRSMLPGYYDDNAVILRKRLVGGAPCKGTTLKGHPCSKTSSAVCQGGFCHHHCAFLKRHQACTAPHA